MVCYRLTFDFVPKIVAIANVDSDAPGYYGITYDLGYIYIGQQGMQIHPAVSGTTLIWYLQGAMGGSGEAQLNGAGVTYQYLAIG